MVKHIVFWQLKESAQGRTKRENAILIKEKLEALQGKIAGLIKIEVGIDFSKTESSADVVLYSEFTTKEALEKYQKDPLHQAVVPFIGEVRSSRFVADYEQI